MHNNDGYSVSETPWTQGPWEYGPDEMGQSAIRDSQNYEPVVCAHDYDTQIDNPADAALIVLAPEMAACILEVERGWKATGGESCGEDGTDMLEALFKKLRAIGSEQTA